MQPPAPETFDQFLQRTEGVICDEITAADLSAGDPAPDCREVYEAWDRGRARVARVYPQAATVKMNGTFFYRPKLHWLDGKTYPIINLAPEGFPPVYVRARSSQGAPALIRYAWPGLIEHEAVHLITLIVDPRLRTPEAIAEDPGQEPYDGAPLERFADVQCHGTTDDLMGDGVLGKRDQCVLPYGAPPAGDFVVADKTRL